MSQEKVEFNSCIYQLEYLLSVHYVEVPAHIIQALGGKLNIRLICTLNGKLSFQCGLMALGEGRAYITVNNKRMKTLKLSVGSEVQVKLERDHSEYGVEMPEELSELLAMDDEGKARFDALALSKRRYIINHVAAVKSSQLRIERAILLIDNLKRLPKGNESFREMLGLPPRE